mgnify:CR=1 FL=1
MIILDIVDDIIDHKSKLSQLNFNEETEYKFKPLYIRLIETNKELKVLSSSTFPDSIPLSFQNLSKDTIYFQRHSNFIIGEIRFLIKGKNHILQVVTDYKVLTHTMENLLYILIIFNELYSLFNVTNASLPLTSIIEGDAEACVYLALKSDCFMWISL